MSVGVYVKARRRLDIHDHNLITAYNALCNTGIEPPAALIDEINARLGYAAAQRYESGGTQWFEPIPTSVTSEEAIIEIDVGGEGSVMYDDGMVLDLSTLPDETYALRIYAQ